jgi:hypothetical protein
MTRKNNGFTLIFKEIFTGLHLICKTYQTNKQAIKARKIARKYRENLVIL